jgi:hypothetical protein
MQRQPVVRKSGSRDAYVIATWVLDFNARNIFDIPKRLPMRLSIQGEYRALGKTRIVKANLTF